MWISSLLLTFNTNICILSFTFSQFVLMIYKVHLHMLCCKCNTWCTSSVPVTHVCYWKRNKVVSHCFVLYLCCNPMLGPQCGSNQLTSLCREWKYPRVVRTGFILDDSNGSHNVQRTEARGEIKLHRGSFNKTGTKAGWTSMIFFPCWKEKKIFLGSLEKKESKLIFQQESKLIF